jgi:excisionase family DNA binding protein
MATNINESSNLAFSVMEAAKVTCLSKSLLRRDIREGKIKTVRPGNTRRILILKEDLVAYLNTSVSNN